MAERLGIVIGVEGGDGTGKTGTAKDLVERIKAKGLTAIYVPIIEGSAVGKIYKSEYTTSEKMDSFRQSTGMLFSVMSTLTTVVEPLRKVYDVIVLDRTLASFYTYQILTNGHSFMKEIFDKVIRQKVYNNYYTLYLTVSPEKAIERMQARGALDVIESKGPMYQQHIQQNYRTCFDTYPELSPSCVITTTDITAEQVMDNAFAFANSVIATEMHRQKK